MKERALDELSRVESRLKDLEDLVNTAYKAYTFPIIPPKQLTLLKERIFHIELGLCGIRERLDIDDDNIHHIIRLDLMELLQRILSMLYDARQLALKSRAFTIKHSIIFGLLTILFSGIIYFDVDSESFISALTCNLFCGLLTARSLWYFFKLRKY